MQQPARVVAQIEHQSLGRTLPLQVVDGLDQVLDRALLELRDADEAVARLDHARAHRLHLDYVAHQPDLERLRLALAHHRQHDRGLGLAAHQLDGLGQRHATGELVVDLDDQIAAPDAGARRRRVVDRRDHANRTLLGADLDAEAAELALGAGLQVLEGVGIEEGRVRVEPREHAADGLLDQLAVVHRLDVVGLDGAEDFGELADLLQRNRAARIAERVGGNAEARRHAGDAADTDQCNVAQATAH